jgi:hypothetical protein
MAGLSSPRPLRRPPIDSGDAESSLCPAPFQGPIVATNSCLDLLRFRGHLNRMLMAKTTPTIDYRYYTPLGLPYLLLILSTAIGGATLGMVARDHFATHWLGLLIGAPVGAVVGAVVFVVSVRARIRYLLPLPCCRNGVCKIFERDYTYARGRIIGWLDPGLYHFRCACGDDYLRRGRRFMLIASDGAPIPYKRLIRWHEWIDDIEPEHNHS